VRFVVCRQSVVSIATQYTGSSQHCYTSHTLSTLYPHFIHTLSTLHPHFIHTLSTSSTLYPLHPHDISQLCTRGCSLPPPKHGIIFVGGCDANEYGVDVGIVIWKIILNKKKPHVWQSKCYIFRLFCCFACSIHLCF
jgi:hypothetical protein